MSSSRQESGLQLLSRLEKARRGPLHLEPRLLPTRPGQGEAPVVVELSGEAGRGKTQCLLHLVADCLLHKGENECALKVPVSAASAVFIDTDYHFSILRLTGILERRIQLQAASDEVEKRVKSALKRLYVCRCRTSSQLLLTLHALDDLCAKDPAISGVFVDSLGAAYWSERAAAGDAQARGKLLQARVATRLGSLREQHNLAIVASTSAPLHAGYEPTDAGTPHSPAAPHSTHATPFRTVLCKAWQSLVTHRLHLSAENGAHHAEGYDGGRVAFDIGEQGLDFRS